MRPGQLEIPQGEEDMKGERRESKGRLAVHFPYYLIHGIDDYSDNTDERHQAEQWNNYHLYVYVT